MSCQTLLAAGAATAAVHWLSAFPSVRLGGQPGFGFSCLLWSPKIAIFLFQVTPAAQVAPVVVVGSNGAQNPRSIQS